MTIYITKLHFRFPMVTFIHLYDKDIVAFKLKVLNSINFLRCFFYIIRETTNRNDSGRGRVHQIK